MFLQKYDIYLKTPRIFGIIFIRAPNFFIGIFLAIEQKERLDI